MPAQQQPDEFTLRGILASELKCWHRLTEDEAKNLVAFVQNMPAKPAQQQEPVALDVTVEGDAAKLLASMLEPVLDDEPTPIRLLVGKGHSGHGLYVASAEYQEEGAALLVYTSPPASKPLTDEQIGMAFRKTFPVGSVVFTNGAIEFARAIEAAHGIMSVPDGKGDA